MRTDPPEVDGVARRLVEPQRRPGSVSSAVQDLEQSIASPLEHSNRVLVETDPHTHFRGAARLAALARHFDAVFGPGTHGAEQVEPHFGRSVGSRASETLDAAGSSAPEHAGHSSERRRPVVGTAREVGRRVDRKPGARELDRDLAERVVVEVSTQDSFRVAEPVGKCRGRSNRAEAASS